MATTSEAIGAIGAAWGRRSALAANWRAPDRRRMLQLVLACIWLLDAVLQFQPYMFTRAFGIQMIGGMAVGNPAGVSHQITWAGRAISHHAGLSGGVFALIQLVIALGIAWRPAVKAALAASVVWALAVWWIGEGLGGVLTRTESPVTGAPGAVILYALLAVLLWPTRRDGPTSPFVAAHPIGATPARALWFLLWGSMSYYALLTANRAPEGLHDLIHATAAGQPHWLSSLDDSVAGLLAHRGLAAAIVLALLFGVIAVGTFLPGPAARTTIVIAVALSGIIWVVGEAFGNVFTGAGTDPNTGPLLILLAVCFWPHVVPAPEPATASSDAARSLSMSGT